MYFYRTLIRIKQKWYYEGIKTEIVCGGITSSQNYMENCIVRVIV
jgi:hypothetical protein